MMVTDWTLPVASGLHSTKESFPAASRNSLLNGHHPLIFTEASTSPNHPFGNTTQQSICFHHFSPAPPPLPFLVTKIGHAQSKFNSSGW
jgi:hypothetical protein